MRMISSGLSWKIVRKCNTGSCWNAKCQAEFRSAGESKSLANMKLSSRAFQAASASIRLTVSNFSLTTALRNSFLRRSLIGLIAPLSKPVEIAWRAMLTRLVRTGGVVRPRGRLDSSTVRVLPFAGGDRGCAGGDAVPCLDSSDGTGEAGPSVAAVWSAVRFAAIVAGDMPMGRGSNLNALFNGRLGDEETGALLVGEITSTGSQSDQPDRRACVVLRFKSSASSISLRSGDGQYLTVRAGDRLRAGGAAGDGERRTQRLGADGERRLTRLTGEFGRRYADRLGGGEETLRLADGLCLRRLYCIRRCCAALAMRSNGECELRRRVQLSRPVGCV